MIEKTSRPFTGRHMLIIMLAFFGTIVSVNMTMVYFATHSWTGLVVKNSYVASQEFNATTAKLKQAAADFHSVIAYNGGKLTISLTDSSRNPANASNMRLKLGRPAHEGEDHVIVLTELGKGTFGADHLLAPGQWSGVVTADVLGHPHWQRPLRLIVKE
jgi:nitrogen fixation protein FixH